LRIIARNTLVRFAGKLRGKKAGAAVEASLNAWFHEVRAASWRTPADVKRSYATASILGEQRVVFNIKGNDYRLVAAIDYRRQVVYIKWVGSHAEYDNIDAKTVRYGD
jgi:mRNA interferase HigB